MPYVCYDCKLGYGHPLIWCAGCGRKMIKVTSIPDWNELRQANWKLEGDKDLWEFYFNGEQFTGSVKKKLIAETRKLYPDLYKTCGIPDDYIGDYNKDIVDLVEHELDRTYYLILKKEKDIIIYLYNPKVVYRLKGSNLPITPPDNWGQVPFERSKS